MTNVLLHQLDTMLFCSVALVNLHLLQFYFLNRSTIIQLTGIQCLWQWGEFSCTCNMHYITQRRTTRELLHHKVCYSPRLHGKRFRRLGIAMSRVRCDQSGFLIKSDSSFGAKLGRLLYGNMWAH